MMKTPDQTNESTEQPSKKTSYDGPSARAASLAALPPILIVLVAYIWLVSIGTWTRWPQPSHDYDQLASAFSHGQLWLDVPPNPALLALTDPYDPALRQDLSYLPDASLYNGRYYLYFGPVPALIILLPKLLIPGSIGDQYLVFLFTCGIYLVLALFSLRIWKRFFASLSPWWVGSSLLALGLMSPFGWVLGSRAAVHDAAIAAGQFFFLAGVYIAFTALDGAEISVRRGLLAGAFWGASLGSRITQIGPIAFMVLMVLTAIMWRQAGSKPAWALVREVSAFVGPIVLALVVLGWYNWARFGSVFESGISYQLALLYFQKFPADVFSLRYIPQNFYNYVLMPARLRYNFPYIWPRMGIRSSIIPGMSLGPLYFAENITGLVFTAPSLILAFVAVLPGQIAGSSTTKDQGADRLRWLQVSLAVSSLVGFGFFLTFFWASERYLLDFLPPAMLLSVIGLWRLATSMKLQAAVRVAALGVAGALLLVSSIVSSLLAIALNADRLRLLDPVLWQQLNNLFRP